MAANSSLIIILTIEMVLYLTTVASVELLDFEQIAKEVEIAIEQMDLPKTIKDAICNDYINVGGYTNSFIGLLDSYWTMSGCPIGFNEKEKLLLTPTSTEDPIEYKVSTQLKYYRKMQEVQCTDYFILNYYLFDANWNIQHIIQHVYNMIKMAYFGKFVVFEWLLKIHINLLTPAGRNHEAWISQLMRVGLNDVEQYKKPLSELVSMCVKHNYLENENSNGCSSTILEHDKFNTQLHIDFNKNISPLPLSFDYLYLSNIREWQQLFLPITSHTTGWNIINVAFEDLIININEQLSTENWITEPFKWIVFQQMLLDSVKLRLYSFIWIKIYSILEMNSVSGYKYRRDIFYRLDYFMSMISDLVEFINIEDRTLNELLKSHSTHKKGEPNFEENYELLIVVTDELKNIKKTMELPEDAIMAGITDDDLKTERAFMLYLGNIEKSFIEFGNFLRTTLDGLSLNVLLFFVEGHHNTELAVFPWKNFNLRMSCKHHKTYYLIITLLLFFLGLFNLRDLCKHHKTH